MQSAKKLSSVLHRLVELVEDEAKKNSDFARCLEEITSDLPKPPARPARKSGYSRAIISIPDVAAALQERGETEFRYWLRGLDMRTLKAIVKQNGFDPGKSSRNWTDPDKFIALIAEQTAARLRRGSAFLPPKAATTESAPPSQ